MSKPFDATLNTLIDAHMVDWAAFLAARTGVPRGTAEMMDTDLSTTLQADKLFRINGQKPGMIHLELESSGRLGIPFELLRYNVATRATTGLPVHSVVVLLRPKATATDLTGLLELPGADDQTHLTFRYTVIRVWQESLDTLLAAGPGLAPLALLTNEAAADLPAAFGRFQERVRAEALSTTAERGLFGSTFVLCGLRYDRDRITDLYRSLSMTLEDSTTYQLILERGLAQGEARGEARGIAIGEARGIVQGVRSLLLEWGAGKFGPAPTEIVTAIQLITDHNRLSRMAKRIPEAAGWDDLIATP